MLSFPYSNRFVWFYWLVANSALKHMLSKLGHCFLQCSSFLCVIYSFHLWKSQGQKSLHSFSINPWRMCVLWRIGLLNNVKMVQTFETTFIFLVHVSGFQYVRSDQFPFGHLLSCWRILEVACKLGIHRTGHCEYPSFHSLVSSFNCCQLMLVSC